MIYSKECEYAIRALTHLAQAPSERRLAKNIAKEANLPSYFLSKILQTLAREKLLTSAKGPNGGFKLAKSPKKVTLYHIKAIIDGTKDLSECAIGLGRCHDRMPCPLHDQFKPIREKIKAYLKKTSLSDVAQAMEKKKKANRRRSK